MLPRTKEYLLITLGGYYGIDSLFKKLKREITKNLSCFSYINYVWKTKCSFGRFLLIAMSQVTQWWRNKELEYYHFTTSNGYRHRSSVAPNVTKKETARLHSSWGRLTPISRNLYCFTPKGMKTPNPIKL